MSKDKTKANQPDETKAKPKVYVVSKRRSVTSKRGILGEGETVRPSDLHGGQDAFDDFVTKGIFVEKIAKA
jgi:hypothetical protein